MAAVCDRSNDRRILIAYTLAVAIMLAGVVPGSADADTMTMYVFCSPDGIVNIRERASIHAEISGRLFFGDAVQVSRRKKDNHGRIWCRVEDVTEWGYGWVSAAYLSDDMPVVTDQDAVIVSNGRVQVRTEPDGERKAWIQPGDQVHVLVSTGAWSLTDRGYIMSHLLEIRR